MKRFGERSGGLHLTYYFLCNALIKAECVISKISTTLFIHEVATYGIYLPPIGRREAALIWKIPYDRWCSVYKLVTCVSQKLWRSNARKNVSHQTQGISGSRQFTKCLGISRNA